MHFLTEIARSFSGFITGTGASNSLAIFNPELDIVKEQTEGRQNVNDADQIIYNLKLDVLSRIIDSSFGAFYIRDLLKNEYTFSGINGNIAKIKDEIQDYVVFLYEDLDGLYKTEIGPVLLSNLDEFPDKSISNYSPASMRKMTSLVPIFTPPPTNADSNNIASSAIIPVVNICNENPKQPSLETPTLGAIIIKDPSLSVQSKNAHFLSVFFNAIPPIEMSKCVPYISLTFYEKNFSRGPDDFLNQSAYFRFDLTEGSDGLELDDRVFNNVREVNARLDNELNAQATFMNIFTSPQTMNNADINREISGLFSDSGNPEKVKKGRVLEPFAPMLSLRSLDISTTSGGYGVTTSRRANMTLFLHDRSRMKEVAPLISVNQLVQTTVKIEFGWSHPDSSVFNQSDGTENEIGVFLNSMRDVQYYTLNTSDVSLDGSGATINLKLSAFGYVEKNIVPASCGRLAPLSLVSDQIITAIDDVMKKSKEFFEKEDVEIDIPKIHQPLRVLRSSASSGYAAVDALQLREFLSLTRSGTATSTDIVKKVFNMFGIDDDEINQNALIPSAQNTINAMPKEGLKKLLARFNNTSVSRNNFDEIQEKLANLILREVPDYFRTPRAERRESDIKKRETQGISQSPDLPVNHSRNIETLKDQEISSERISLGSLMCSFVGSPMLSTGQFSEVQMIFYPINNKAGGARIHTTASLPLSSALVNSAFEKLRNVDENTFNANFTASSIVDFFADLVLSDNSLYYGEITPGFDEIDASSITQSAVISDDLSRKALLEKISSTFENALDDYNSEHGESLEEKNLEDSQKDAIAQRYYNKVIEENRADAISKIYSNDGLPKVDVNAIVKPFITAKFETLPAINPNPILKSGGNELNTLGKISNFLNGEDLGGSESGYYDSSKILRIHVFDTNVTISAKAQLVSDMIDNLGVKTAGESIIDGQGNGIGLEKELKSDIPGETSSAKISLPELSAHDLKAYVKRQFPSITYGAYNSVIRSLSVNSTTGDSIAQAFAIEAEVARREGRTTKGERGNAADSEVTVFPANLKVEMLGIPFIAMGNQIYVDLGTNTDLDNVYMVNSVTHTISPGSFTTSCDLKLQNQGMVRNLRGDISKAIEKLVAE
jgi:hypothetical protein